MSIAKSILVCVCLVGLTQPVWSQKPNESAKPAPGILGYLDPKTGAFRPLVQNPPEEEEIEPAIAPTTGTFVFNFTITIASKNLGGDTVLCSADATTFDTTGLSATESASVKATVSGSAAKCTVTIPYSWPLKTPASDSVTLSYSVEAVNTSTTTGGQPTRSSFQSLPTIKVPASGATTTETIASTI
jgi:hypothetical protein